MSLTQPRLRDKCRLVAGTSDCRKTFSGRSARLADNGGRRVSLRRQVTPTCGSQVQTPSTGSSFDDIPSTSKWDFPIPPPSYTYIQAPALGSTHIQAPAVGSTHIQAPVMGSTRIQAPLMGSTHIQATPVDNTHSEIPSMSNSHIQALSVCSPQIHTPVIYSSHLHRPSISCSHHVTSSMSSSYSKTKTPSMGNSGSSTRSDVNAHIQTCITGNQQDHNPPIDNPQDQGDRISISGDKSPRMNNRLEHTSSPSNSQEKNPPIDSPPDQGHPADKSDALNPPTDRRQERASSPSNSQEPARSFGNSQEPARSFGNSQEPARSFGNSQEPARSTSISQEPARSTSISQEPAPSVNEPPDPSSSVSGSQNLVSCGDVVDILHSYKSGIHQLRSLRLQLLKDPTWFTIQTNPNYHRSQRHSNVSEGLKTLRANISQGKSEQIPHLVKKHHGIGYFEDDFKNPHFDKYTLLLEQDRKNLLRHCSRQNKDTSKRLHEKDPERQPGALISKELNANTGKSFSHTQSRINYSQKGFIDQCLAASKGRKQTTDKKCFYKNALDSSFRTYEGQNNLVKLLPRLRLTGLSDLVGDSISKTASKSMTLSAGNGQQQDGGHKWGSEHEKFSSKWTNWKRWIGSTLTLRQTTSGVSGYNSGVSGYNSGVSDYSSGVSGYSSVIKGGLACRTGTFNAGDSCLHQSQLSDSCTDAKQGNDANHGTDVKHGTNADSSWHRRRRDPPASPSDLEDFLSPVTRVVITTTERNW